MDPEVDLVLWLVGTEVGEGGVAELGSVTELRALEVKGQYQTWR